MISTLSGVNQQFIYSLNNIQTQMQTAESQLTSGYRVQQPSDDPSVVSEILELNSEISQNQQIQSNLNTATTNLDTADSTLQDSVQAVQSAITLATEGASSTTDAQTRANLAQQVSGLQQTLVGLSQATVNGRYIFSGDLDSQPQYQMDASQPNGVQQMFSTTATPVITDATGVSIPVALTAQQIFDARNTDGSDASGNVFAAVNSLLTSLQNNDTAGITQAASSLQTASDYLNQQLAFYGEAEDRVSDASSLAQKFQLQENNQLSKRTKTTSHLW